MNPFAFILFRLAIITTQAAAFGTDRTGNEYLCRCRHQVAPLRQRGGSTPIVNQTIGRHGGMGNIHVERYGKGIVACETRLHVRGCDRRGGSGQDGLTQTVVVVAKELRRLIGIVVLLLLKWRHVKGGPTGR